MGPETGGRLQGLALQVSVLEEKQGAGEKPEGLKVQAWGEQQWLKFCLEVSELSREETHESAAVKEEWDWRGTQERWKISYG